MNAWEQACREWMKGCSCAAKGQPWQCIACTRAFHGRLETLANLEPSTSSNQESNKAHKTP